MSEQNEDKQSALNSDGASVPSARRKRPVLRSLGVGGSIAAGAGAAIFLISGSTTQCRGSTRSARLIWEARQQQTLRELNEGANCENTMDQELPAKADGNDTPK